MRVLMAAWAEPASGPGWANQPVRVLVWDGEKYDIEFIQPEHQTREMVALYGVSAAAAASMLRAVRIKEEARK